MKVRVASLVRSIPVSITFFIGMLYGFAAYEFFIASTFFASRNPESSYYSLAFSITYGILSLVGIIIGIGKKHSAEKETTNKAGNVLFSLFFIYLALMLLLFTYELVSFNMTLILITCSVSLFLSILGAAILAFNKWWPKKLIAGIGKIKVFGSRKYSSLA